MQKQLLDKLLSDNQLVRKELPLGPNSLLRAISDALYFTTAHHEKISQMLVQYLKKFIQNNQVPKNLSILQTNYALQQDFCQQPNFSGFTKINLELVSLLFRVQIKLYSVSEDDKLQVKLTNNNCKRIIELCRSDEHYEPVFSTKFIEDTRDVQQIIYSILSSGLNYEYKIPKQFKNIEYDLWLDEKIQTPIMKKTSTRPRSLSDQFNTDPEKIDQLYESLENQYNNMFNLDEKKQIQKISEEIGILSSKPTKPEELQLQSQLEQIFNLRGNPPGINVPKQQNSQQAIDTPKKHIVLDESESRFTGRLKFFDEAKNYGFLVSDQDNNDIFVHYDDLQKAGITKEFIRSLGGSQYRTTTQVNHFLKYKAPRFSFTLLTYVGKYNKSRKAVDLKVLID